jgi:hypothetical protein
MKDKIYWTGMVEINPEWQSSWEETLEIARNIRTLKTDLKEPEWKNVKWAEIRFSDELL